MIDEKERKPDENEKEVEAENASCELGEDIVAGSVRSDDTGDESCFSNKTCGCESVCDTAEQTASSTPEELVKEKDAQLAAIQEKHVRLQAEFQNYKKRMEREKESFLKYANERLLVEFLAVIDNIDLAVSHAKDGSQGFDGLLEGLELTTKQLTEMLKKFGVETIVATGVEFNPEVHQAMMQVESDEVKNGEIAAEIRKGYKLHDRVIRPAMVSVSKGAPSNSNQEEPQA